MERMNNMALNSSITLTGTGKFIGNGSSLTNLPLGSYSTTSLNDTKYLKSDGTNNMALNSSITLTGTGKFVGDGSLLSKVYYNTLSNLPDLTLYNGWTKSGNDIYTTSLTSGKVGIGITNPTGAIEFYDTKSKLKLGHETRFALNQFFSTSYLRFLTSYTITHELLILDILIVMIIL
jgi:hypothetical protein